MKQKLSIFMGVVFFAAVVTWLSLAEYSAELRNAYDWAFTNKITTQASIEEARLDSEITRQALSKMMVVYSKDMLGKQPDYSLRCNFTDKEEITEDLKWYAIEACQLWIMWEWNNAFDPMWKVTVAQFWTILSRALWWDMYEGSDPYYLAHLHALEEKQLLDDISNPEERNITRWEVITALMRSVNWVWSSVLLYSEDLDEHYENFDPEIEYLMDENNLSEKEKKVIRDYVNELESWLYNNLNNLFLYIEDEEETDVIKNIKIAIDSLNEIKKIYIKYNSDLKKIYEQLNVDLSDTTPYTPWEKFKKLEEFNEAFFNIIEEEKWLLNKIILMREEFDRSSEDAHEKFKEKYEDELNLLQEDYERQGEEAIIIKENLNKYFEDYKIMNKYWRMYQDSLYDSELSSDATYSPKNAKSISWYLVWEDLTRYQGDIKDNKLEWKWVLVGVDFSYSGSFKNNYPYGYWVLKGEGFSYEWEFKYWKYDWYWIYSGIDSIYTWEWSLWYRHWNGVFKDKDFILSWLWKKESFYSGTINSSNGYIYEWECLDWYFNGKWKLILASKDIYEWNFESWHPQWFWALTLVNWDIYSWEWNYWLLSGQAVYIKDWKVILWKNIDIIENQRDSTIIVSDWIDTITMMDKNIWATEAWTWETSYGSFFKWGNNTEFHSLDTWDSKEFIEATTWVWKEKDQGPCPKGYHIPTTNEWNWVISMWELKNNYTDSIKTKDQFYNFINTFKIPLAGYRFYYTPEKYVSILNKTKFTWDVEQESKNNSYINYLNTWFEDDYEWRYRISKWLTYEGGESYNFITSTYSWENYNYMINMWGRIDEWRGYSIRCFKD